MLEFLSSLYLAQPVGPFFDYDNNFQYLLNL